MFSNLNVFTVRDFVNKERVYMLLLAFIILVNACFVFAQKVPIFNAGPLQKSSCSSSLTEKEAHAGLGYQALRDGDALWSELLREKRSIFILMNILGFIAICVFSLGLFLDIRIFMAKVRKREIFKVACRHLPSKWGIWDIFKLVIIFVFCSYMLHIIEIPFLSFMSANKNLLTFISLLNTGIMDLLILGFILYFIKIKYGQEIRTIGLEIQHAHRFIFLGALSYVAFLPILALLLLLIFWLATVFNYLPQQQPLFDLFFLEQKAWILACSVIMVVLLGPIVEEVFFRGFAYNAIKRRWGVKTAILVTAFVFAALHKNLIGFFPILALGLLLAYMYERTGSLISAITIHILHNTIMVTFLFLGRYLVHLAAS